MSGTSTRRLRELLRQAEVKTAFDEDDLKQIVSSASEGSSSGRDRSSVLTPSTLGMSASGDLGISPGDDNGSEVSRLSIPSSLLDELHSTPRIGTKTSSRTPQSIMKTPNLDFSRVPDVGAGVHRLTLENAQLRQELDDLQHDFETGRSNADVRASRAIGDMRSQLEAKETECEEARKRAEHLQEQVDKCARDMQVSREPFQRSLHISSAMAQELKLVPPERLSLKEFIELRLHQEQEPLRESLAAARRERDAAQQALEEKVETSEKHSRSVLHRTNLAEGRLEAAAAQISVLEAAQERLQQRLATALDTVDELHRKGQEYDALHARAGEMETAAARDAKLIAQQSESLSRATNAAQDAERRLRDTEQKAELLAADKRSLSGTVDDLRAAIRRAEADLSRATRSEAALQEQLAASKRSAEEDRRALTAAAEGKVDEELARLRSQQASSSETLRLRSEEVWQTQVRNLRADLTAAEARITALSAQMETTAAGKAAAEREAAAANSSAETTAAELRGSLKLKTAALQSAQAEGHDLRAELAEARAELRSKQGALEEGRRGVAELDASTSKRIAQLEGALESAKGALTVYEHLEGQMDAAIVAAGEGAVASGDTSRADDEYSAFGDSEDSGNKSAAGTLINAAGVPVAAARRMRQAVLLARQLAEARRSEGSLRRALASAQAALTKERQAGRDLARTIAEASQPHTFVVGRLRELEAALRDAEHEAADASTAAAAARREVDIVAAERDRAEGELASVLARRGEAEGLASLVREALMVRGGASGLAVEDVQAGGGYRGEADARSMWGAAGGASSVRSDWAPNRSPPGTSTPPMMSPGGGAQQQLPTSLGYTVTTSAAPPAQAPSVGSQGGSISTQAPLAASVPRQPTTIRDTTGRVWNVGPSSASVGGSTTVTIESMPQNSSAPPPASGGYGVPTVAATHVPMATSGGGMVQMHPPPQYSMPYMYSPYTHGQCGNITSAVSTPGPTSMPPRGVEAVPPPGASFTTASPAQGGTLPPRHPSAIPSSAVGRLPMSGISSIAASSPPGSVGSGSSAGVGGSEGTAGGGGKWHTTRHVAFNPEESSD